MTLQVLVTIVLRLYTIYLVIEALLQLAVAIPMMLSMPTIENTTPHFEYLYLLSPLLIFAIGAILWASTFRISSMVVKGVDREINFAALTREDLYHAAFVFLGVYFVLSSIYGLLYSGYQYFSFEFPLGEGNPTKGKYLWPFLGHLLTFIAGYACVAGMNTWTKKLIRLDNKRIGSEEAS